jgi:IS30 family transposase
MVNYTQLTLSLRELIATKFNEQGKSIRQIAKEIEVSPNTVSQEIKRNKVLASDDLIIDIKYDERKMRLIDKRFVYKADYANDCAKERSKIVRCQKKIIKGGLLYREIDQRLKSGFKPDVIAGRLKLEYPDDLAYHISHEAIYQYVYAHPECKWYEYLKKTRKKRKPRGDNKKDKPKDENHVSIHDRTENINNRLEIGHFEADSVIGQATGSKKNIVTLVDRKTRLMFALFTADKTTVNTCGALREMLLKIGDKAKSITYDNGTEFANHHLLMEEFGIISYFADPYSSWQRGTNERHNGLLRRYFPKKKNFEDITDEELQEVVDFWNNYPRKILGYKTPNEVWNEEVAKLELERGV